MKTNFNTLYHDLLYEFEKAKEPLNESQKLYFNNILIDALIRVTNIRIREIISEINEEYLGKLLHNIKDDKGYFMPIINPLDINKVYVIKPKMNNARIIKQQGAFLIFGVSPSSNKVEIKPMVEILEKWHSSTGQKIIIDHRAKESILKELDKLGINQASLFPEIEKVSDYIKDKYTQAVKPKK